MAAATNRMTNFTILGRCFVNDGGSQMSATRQAVEGNDPMRRDGCSERSFHNAKAGDVCASRSSD